MTARDNLKRLAEKRQSVGLTKAELIAAGVAGCEAIAKIEERDRKVERLIRASAAVADAGLQAEELYKGRSGSGSALWREYEEAVTALQAEQGGE